MKRRFATHLNRGVDALFKASKEYQKAWCYSIVELLLPEDVAWLVIKATERHDDYVMEIFLDHFDILEEEFLGYPKSIIAMVQQISMMVKAGDWQPPVNFYEEAVLDQQTRAEWMDFWDSAESQGEEFLN